MTIRPEIEAFVKAVEVFANRTFHFHYELAVLLQIATDSSMKQAFEDLTFFAKFVVNASHILKRAGVGAEETAKLSIEYQHNLEKTSNLLRTMLENAPKEFSRSFEERFLILTHPSLQNLHDLLYELSWIKNYNLDRTKLT